MAVVLTQTVTVFTKPSCVQCDATRKALERAGIVYDVIDVTTNPAALEYVTEDLGYLAAPIVVISEHHHWSGFRPDLIAQLARTLTTT